MTARSDACGAGISMTDRCRLLVCLCFCASAAEAGLPTISEGAAAADGMGNGPGPEVTGEDEETRIYTQVGRSKCATGLDRMYANQPLPQSTRDQFGVLTFSIVSAGRRQSCIFSARSQPKTPEKCEIQEIAPGINMLAAEQVETFFESIVTDP